jgi:hypothetical protein
MSDDERRLIPDPSPEERPSSPTPPASRVPAPSERGEGGMLGSSGRPPLLSSTGEGVGGAGEPWHQALPAIADRLREIGYDIATSQSGSQPGDSIVARRDLGDRAVVLAIDVGGRFRAEISWVVGEWPSRDEIAGVPVQVIDAVWRAVTVTGQMAGPDQVVAVVSGLGSIASWAGVLGFEPPPPPS